MNKIIEERIYNNIETLNKEILKRKKSDPESSLLEIIEDYCKENNIDDIEVISNYLTHGLKEKLEKECEKLRLIKKEERLPL